MRVREDADPQRAAQNIAKDVVERVAKNVADNATKKNPPRG
jgi:hypothetical protein